MKNHELLDLIGEVDEDYVQAADGKVIRPRFGWRKLAVCAACAVLVLGAYPVYRMSQLQAPSGLLPLHDYTIVEGGGMTTLEDGKVPARERDEVSGGKGESGMDGAEYTAPGQDAPADEAAAAQYSKLLQGMGGVDGMEPAAYPHWFAGAWLEQGALAVAVVDGFRTPELEARIEEWCGGGVVFQDAKYSYPHLNSLMEQTAALLDGTGLSCGIGVYVMDNCLGVDIYSDGKDIPKEVLVKLGQLDPEGDAIRVRLFTDKLDTLTDQAVKDPAPDRGGDPDANAPVPGGVTHPTPEDGDQMEEEGRAAVYDLPQDKYDAVLESE